MRKLAGTRAGRPVTIAFETELMMQDGTRLFTSDEAFMSADWVGNAYIIYAFHTRKNEFFYPKAPIRQKTGRFNFKT